MNSKYKLCAFVFGGLLAVGSLGTVFADCHSSSSSSDALSTSAQSDADMEESDSADSKTGNEPVSDAESWADSVMAKLTFRQRIAQLFIPRWDFSNGAISAATMRKNVVEDGVGGFLLGKGRIAEYAGAINQAQRQARVPLLVTLDGEWGLNMRVPDSPRFPKNIALGAIQDSSLLEEYGREVARQCRLLGIHVDFAPVLDVNSNPDNPVIGYRSFGEDPERVAKAGAAFCKGMESGGVMSVGKHFPGHGDTSVDSHKALPSVDHSTATLESVDFLPFVEAAKAGMSGVMVGHLRVPALDKSGVPASLSKIITTDVLKNKLGFDGLVFTDALAMKGAATTGENNCVSAFNAGADVLLNSSSPSKDIQAMVDAVKSGRISEREIDQRCRKMLVYKYKLGLASQSDVKKEGLESKINSAQTRGLLDRLAKASVTVVRNNDGLLPLSDLSERSIAVVCLGASATNEFAAVCKKYAPVNVFSVRDAAAVSKAVAEAKKADVVIVGVFNSDAPTRDAYEQLQKSCRELVSVFFINPFKMQRFTGLSSAPTLVVAYDDTKELFSASAQALFGGIDVNGRFPVNIKGVASLGEGVDLKKKD
ncbi:MAG: glycoside hydrolase family 3 protein [Paramuribaculum sp.]|nr:glycoside hydrolase family 3 protein [Paramuribaculum sp.]